MLSGARKRRVREWKLRIQGGRCFYCGSGLKAEHATLDHVEPRSRGGTDRVSNLVASCRLCNRAKGSAGLAEFLNRRGVQQVLFAAQNEGTVDASCRVAE